MSDDARFSDSFDSLDLRAVAPLRARRARSASRRSSSASTSSTSRTSSACPRTQLLRLRERARARQLGSRRSRLPALVVLRSRAHDGGRRLRLGRPAGLPARPEGAVLSAGARRPGSQRRLGLGAAAALVVGGTVGVGIFLTPGRDGALARLARARVPGLGVHGRGGALRRAQPAASSPRATRRRAARYVYLREAYGPAARVPLRLEVPAGDGPRAHRGPRDGPRRLRRRPPCPASSPKAVALGAIVVDRRGQPRGRAPRGGRSATALAVAKIALLAGARRVGLRLGRGRPRPLRAVLRAAARRSRRSCRRSRAPSCSRSSRSAAGGRRPSSPGEVRDPRRTLPRALALGVGAVTLLYVAVSAVVPLPGARSVARAPTRPSPRRRAMALFGPSGGRALVGAGGRVRDLGACSPS